MNLKKCFSVFLKRGSKVEKLTNADSLKIDVDKYCIPEPSEFYLKTPLYHKYMILPQSFQGILNVEFYRNTLDTYCKYCDATSTFKSLIENYDPYGNLFANAKYNNLNNLSNQNISVDQHLDKSFLVDDDYMYKNRIIINVFECQRCNEEHLHYIMRVANNEFEKIGQYPSIASLNDFHLRKYRKILDKEEFIELSKAVGLFSHGIGIGAFVYLRRIFESLIIKTFHKTMNNNKVEYDIFKIKRMDDKIEYLKDELPEFLVKNSHMYGILSKGIHELTEEECLQYFPTIRSGIEIILDDELTKKESKLKIKNAEMEIDKIRSQIK